MIEKTCTPNDPKCKGCKPIGTLNFTLPKIKGFGVWQIWTSSWNSIVNINSSIDMIKAMTGGNIAFIPLKLILQEHSATITTHKGQFQKKVYVMSLNIDSTMGEFYQRHSLNMKIQRGIQENEGFAELVDTAKKVQSLNELKQRNHLKIDDDEFVQNKVLKGNILESDPFECPPFSDDEDELICSECGMNITEAQLKLSKHKFGRALCAKCQVKVD